MFQHPKHNTSFIAASIYSSFFLQQSSHHSKLQFYHFPISLSLSLSLSLQTMMYSFKNYIFLLHKYARAFVHPITALRKKKKLQKPEPAAAAKRVFSGFELLNSSFAAMEVSNQLRQVFNFIDANGDGKISSMELSEVLLCLGHEKSTAAKEAEGMVKQVDCNGNGFIDLDEFLDIIVGAGAGDEEKKEDYLMDAFLIFDTDKDGLISAKELNKVLTNLGFDKCSLEECSRMIKGVDKDGDGFVNFDEFRSMMMASSI